MLETPEKMHKAFSKWGGVRDRNDVSKRKVLVLVVAGDERSMRRDWIFVRACSCVADDLLGRAKQLHVYVYDSMQRVEVANRTAKNMGVLVRRIQARSDASAPQVECQKASDVRVETQQTLYAYGRLLCHAATVVGLPPPPPSPPWAVGV